MRFMGRSLKDQLSNNPRLMKPSWCPHSNSCLILDVTADVVLEMDDDGSLHNSAVTHHLLVRKIMKEDDRPPMEPSEGNSPNDWMKKGTCLASSCGKEEHVRGTDHCLHKLSEQHCQLAKVSQVSGTFFGLGGGRSQRRYPSPY